MSHFSDKIDEYFSVSPDKIAGFFKEYRFLSNYHGCPVKHNGVLYTSSEAAYQAAKSLDPEVHKRFASLTANDSKKQGQTLNIRADWDHVKYGIMFEILHSKFTLNPDLKELLMATGDRYLEETNHWGDTYWGVDCSSGKGQNQLGAALMNLRTLFRLPQRAH